MRYHTLTHAYDFVFSNDSRDMPWSGTTLKYDIQDFI